MKAMTIDSSWLRAFKDEFPHAFTRASPFAPAAVFVDGQIKLMQARPHAPMPWDEFIRVFFARPLRKHLDACDAVVLAFDNYELVPRAKCMTQAQRRRAVEPHPFEEHAPLPSAVPDGEDWVRCLANRRFKGRVVELVLAHLPALLVRPGKRLVLDYKGPVEYTVGDDGAVRAAPLEELAPLGESDVKFARYADRFGRLLVDSIDGDSVPIALLHHELCLRAGRCPPLMSVYRLELAAGEKRKRRTYEFVDVHALYEGLRQAVAQCLGRVVLASHSGHEMAMLVALIGLTGTDFSRGLPQLSGQTVYGFLPDLWPALALAFDPAEDRLRVDEAADGLVGLIYRTKFARHAGGAGGLAGVLAGLRGSALSKRTKDSLPSEARVACTVRNVNWVLCYWTRETAPDPIQPCFGFRLAGGAAEYAD